MRYATLKADGPKISYREAGGLSAPRLLLYTASRPFRGQYRNLMPVLAEKFRLIASDYPGLGYSDMRNPSSYACGFDGAARLIKSLLEVCGLTRFGLHVPDCGAPPRSYLMPWKANHAH